MLLRCAAQLLVPAGELEFFAGGERQGARKMNGVVSTQRMGAGTLGGFREQGAVDGVTVDSAPEALQVIRCPAELGRSQAAALAHPGQGCSRLHMRDRGGSDAVGVAIGTLRLLRARLVDQQLDQGAGVQVETQRRPSET